LGGCGRLKVDQLDAVGISARFVARLVPGLNIEQAPATICTARLHLLSCPARILNDNTGRHGLKSK
jgi:hypothetical protein